MNMRLKIPVLLMMLFLMLPLRLSAAESLGKRMAGKFVIEVEKTGEVWYVDTVKYQRYLLDKNGAYHESFKNLASKIGIGDFQKIVQAGIEIESDKAVAAKYSGKILLLESDNSMWYVNPKDLKKYNLSGSYDNVISVLRKIAVGINRENLAHIHKPGNRECINEYSCYDYNKKIATVSGDYYADIIEIDLANPKLKIMTPVATPYPESSNKERVHGAKNLARFAFENNGFAAINGSYFESSNKKRLNYYFFPVYDAKLGKMVNESELKYWTTGPVMAFDVNNKFYYYRDTLEFKKAIKYDAANGWQIGSSTGYVKLAAAMGDKPRLIEDGMNTLIDWEVDTGQFKTKTSRNAIAYKDGKLYLVIVRKATLLNLADVMKAMKVEYALNLDGGYSSAMIYNGEYMFGPGRNVVNAFVFAEK